MAFRYLIDGYNLLYALPEMPRGSWEEKREQLLAFLRQKRPQGRNPITIVFDSREGSGDRHQQGDFTVLFTAGETADDRISELVRQAANPRALIVVSNDQGIRLLVRGTGAKFLSATDFLKKAVNDRVRETPSKGHPSDQAEDITDELKKKWL